MIDDRVQRFFLFWLEWQVGELILPLQEVFELRTGRIAWNLDAVVTNGTSILVVFLDFSARNLETFAVVPGGS